MTNAAKATVTSIEGDHAILSFEDGQKLRVSLAACEGQLKVGAEVRVIVAALGSEDAGRQGLARELLNEILGT